MWNRQRYVEDPSTGKRVSRINPPDAWIVTEVRELRIIDDALWRAVKTHQGELAVENATVIARIRGGRQTPGDRHKANPWHSYRWWRCALASFRRDAIAGEHSGSGVKGAARTHLNIALGNPAGC